MIFNSKTLYVDHASILTTSGEAKRFLQMGIKATDLSTQNFNITFSDQAWGFTLGFSFSGFWFSGIPAPFSVFWNLFQKMKSFGWNNILENKQEILVNFYYNSWLSLSEKPEMRFIFLWKKHFSWNFPESRKMEKKNVFHSQFFCY